MPRRGENIHKRKDGRWEGRYKSGTNANGGTLYRSVYGKTYNETKEKLFQAKQNHVSTSSQPKGALKLNQLLTMWMDANKIRLKRSTLYKYQYMIDKHINKQIGDIPLSSLSSTVINQFINEKLTKGRLDESAGLAPSYVRTIIHIINAAIEYAVSENMCEPLRSRIIKPSINKDELAILTLEEQHKLEAYLFQDMDNTKLGILLSLYMGLRIGEVCALSWEDVDFRDNVIYVRHTVARISVIDSYTGISSKLIIDSPKTKNSMREIPIPSLLSNHLKKIWSQSNSNFVISGNSTFMNPRTYEYRYHKILKECGINEINYHTLRHTFATRCVEAGVDIKSLSEILGHASVSITLGTYIHSSMDMKRHQIEKLSTLTRCE